MWDNLQRKTVSALFWSFLQAFAQRAVQFVVGIVLARLLFPEQFGLIGMLTIFIAVIRAFLDSGFGAALIQKREISQTDICSIFYFNIAVGAAAACLLSLAAPWIAAFYRQPILTPLTRALSLTFIIDSFAMIQSTLLTKEINFKTQTKVSVIAGILSGATGITMAVLGFGVWSLVAVQLSTAFYSAASLWFFSAWRPQLLFSFSALRGMFAYGSRLLFSGVLNQIFENIHLIVIGRLFSATDLGFFARAKNLTDIPSQTLAEMTGRVTFPVFCSVQDDPARLKRGLKKALRVLAFVTFPVMIGLAVVARPLIQVLLTDKWLPAAPYLQLLCLAGALYPVHLMNLSVLQATGRSDLFLRLEIIKKALIALNIMITWHWGITAMVYGMVVTSVISFYLNSYYNGVRIDYPFGEQVLDLLPYIGVTLTMAAAVYAIGLVPFPRPLSRLATQIVTGGGVYILLCRVLRLQALAELWQGMNENIRPLGLKFIKPQAFK